MRAILGTDTPGLTFWAPVLVVVAVALYLGASAMRSNSRRRAAAEWGTTHGTILMATIQVQRAGSSRREIPAVTYTYQVGPRVFQGSRINVGDEPGSTLPDGHARSVLARYPVGAKVQVFYDLADPVQSALER